MNKKRNPFKRTVRGFDQALWDGCLSQAILKSEWRGECICYTARTWRRGYGKVWFNGKDRRIHRLAMEARVGRVLATEELVLHSCDNPPCFNSAHLRVGTQFDNIQDAVIRNRHRGFQNIPILRGVQPAAEQRRRGIGVNLAKLTDEKVREIRKLRDEGLSYRQIEKRVGVTDSCVWKLCARKTWAHVV